MKHMKPAMKNTNACMPGIGRQITTTPVTSRPGTQAIHHNEEHKHLYAGRSPAGLEQNAGCNMATYLNILYCIREMLQVLYRKMRFISISRTAVYNFILPYNHNENPITYEQVYGHMGIWVHMVANTWPRWYNIDLYTCSFSEAWFSIIS